MKKVLFCLVLVCTLVLATACGGNKLVGTWEGDSNDGLKTTFIFAKDGKVTYKNEYGFDSKGTYEVKDNKVTISLKSWDEKKVYKYEIKDGKLKLTATDKYSPSYNSMTKKK